jgi:hypothetical protein
MDFGKICMPGGIIRTKGTDGITVYKNDQDGIQDEQDQDDKCIIVCMTNRRRKEWLDTSLLR